MKTEKKKSAPEPNSFDPRLRPIYENMVKAGIAESDIKFFVKTWADLVWKEWSRARLREKWVSPPFKQGETKPQEVASVNRIFETLTIAGIPKKHVAFIMGCYARAGMEIEKPQVTFTALFHKLK